MERLTINKLSPFLKAFGFDLTEIVKNNWPGGHFLAKFQRKNFFLFLEKSFYLPDYQELVVVLGDVSFQVEGISNCCSTYNIINFKYGKQPVFIRMILAN